jgi:hypothetical protein
MGGEFPERKVTVVIDFRLAPEDRPLLATT